MILQPGSCILDWLLLSEATLYTQGQDNQASGENSEKF